MGPSTDICCQHIWVKASLPECTNGTLIRVLRVLYCSFYNFTTVDPPAADVALAQDNNLKFTLNLC